VSALTTYQPKYSNSWALVIGIDKYQHIGNLAFASNDANGMARVLTDSFGFPKENVTILLNEQANGSTIRKAFFKFAHNLDVGVDDRLVVFFAGHGHTERGRRGEVGFLVPYDGNLDNLESLIRWDELTRNADLIAAKHIFFVMDACYGGLALTRGHAFGAMRFVSDMLQRYSRQVLTAGKADEVVADGNGVRAGHSVFTAHLLNGLEGAAATKEGIITASGVMAYVYDQVGKDQYSRQTPHYGFLDGDGDFIFDTTVVDRILAEAKEASGGQADEKEGDADILINASPPILAQQQEQSQVVIELKELLSVPQNRIRLDDYVSHHIRRFLEEADLRHFPVQMSGIQGSDLVERIQAYETLSKDLQQVATLLARWGDADQVLQLERILTRLAETDKGTSGLVVLLKLCWYPLMLLMYCAGIAAIASKNYRILKIVFDTTVQPDAHDDRRPLVVHVMSNMTDIHDTFKHLPGQEKKYVPRSEHLFTLLQPVLEDLLFLGRGYEQYFDEFEVLMALAFAHATQHGWGPPGRFAWKHSSRLGLGQSPYRQIVEQAEKYGTEWQPLRAGLFDGSLDNFKKQAEAYGERLSKLGWW